MFLVRKVLVVFAVLLSADALAADSSCEGCTYSEMLSRSITLGKGDHRVYSLSTNVVEGFRVFCRGDVIATLPADDGRSQGQGSGKPARTGKEKGVASVNSIECPFDSPLDSESRPLSPIELSAFSHVHNFYVANGSKVDRIDLDMNLNEMSGVGNSGESVYNVLSDYQVRTNLFAWVSANSNSLQGYFAALTAGRLAHFQILPNQVVLQVTFRDNTKVKLLYHAGIGQISIIRNTARNPDGSAIVEFNAAEYQGNYFLNGTNIEAYVHYLQQMGIPVTNGGGSRLTCSWDGVTLNCMVVPN